MPCPVMRGGLRLILEGSGEFEMGRLRQGRCGGGDLGGAERTAGRVATRTASAIRSGCRTAAQQLRRKLGDDASDPALIFAEPRVGYRMEKGEKQRE